MASFDAENLPPKVAAAATRYTFRGEIRDPIYPIYRGPNADGIHRLASLDSPTTEGTCVLYYINGMRTSAESHERAANYLAGIVGQPVIGLYNLTGISGKNCDERWSRGWFESWTVDSVQSILQYLTPIGRGLGIIKPSLKLGVDQLDAKNWNWAGDALDSLFEYLDAKWTVLPQHERIKILKYVLTVNLVSTTLLDRLVHDVSSYDRVVIVAHSQGNLSAANTLWALTHVLCERTEPLAKIDMIGLASPNPSWPTKGLRMRLYHDPSDAVRSASVPVAVADEDRRSVAIRPDTTVPGSSHDVMRHMADYDFQRYVRDAIGLKS